MGRIQSQFGLVTGTDIGGTVDQLIAISAQPRDRLVNRTAQLTAEQTAITELTASVIAVQLAGNRLSDLSAFQSRDANVSNDDAISATAGSGAAEGNYTVRTLRTAATHRAGSVAQFASADAALGYEGTIEITPSGFLDHSLPLSRLNGGRGVEKGSFRLTDRSGASADVDIRDARTIDEVITAINDADVGIVATTADGRIRLRDTTGRTDGNLIVTQLGNQETLADLGLYGIDDAAPVATGGRLLDVVTAATPVSQIGDGVDLSGDVDLAISLSDGSELSVRFGDFSTPDTPAVAPTGTLASGDLTFTDTSLTGELANLQINFQPSNGFFATNDVDLTGNVLTVSVVNGTTADQVRSLIENDADVAGRLSIDLNVPPGTAVDRNDTGTLDAGSPAVLGDPAIADPTLGNLATFLNDNYVGQISASVVDGQLRLTDLTTTGGGEFRVRDGDGTAATDLNLLAAADGDTITGNRPVPTLRGVSLGELAGGRGLNNLTSIDITTADGVVNTVDLSAATNTAEIVDAINASGGDVLARLNDAKTGFRLRDVSGADGGLTVTSTDDTASRLGLDGDASNNLLIGRDLQRQSVFTTTKLADLGGGITSGSFTIADSSGTTSAINLSTDDLDTVGDLIDRINDLSIDVSATINDRGDGITIIDNAGGNADLTITDTGSGTAAAQLGLAGTATEQVIDGNTVDAIIGSDAARIEITADDSLASIAAKITESGRFATASVVAGDDGSFRLSTASTSAGQAGRFGISVDGFDFETRTISTGRDGLIAVSVDGGTESFVTSTDGVFELSGGGEDSASLTRATGIEKLSGGIVRGSFRITDSAGGLSAINLVTDEIKTVGDLVDQINSLGVAVTAKINDDGDGIELTDTAGGDGDLSIEDVGNGTAASALGLTGEPTSRTVDGVTTQTITAVGTATSADTSGLAITLKELSDDPISIDVSTSRSGVIGAVETFADQYNNLIEKIEQFTEFDPDAETVGLLFGSSETLRITSAYERVLSGTIRGAGEFRSAGAVGLQFDDRGRLSVDKSKLGDALEQSPDAAAAFFATDTTGLADRLSDVADRIAGVDNSLLFRRRETIQTQTERNNERIETLNNRLDRERERLLQQFFRTEEAIGRIQSNQSSVASIAPITIPN